MSRRKSSVEPEPAPKTSASWNSANEPPRETQDSFSGGGDLPPPPQLTFTEDEVKKVIDFLNLVATRASFDKCSIKEMIEIGKSYQFMCQHAKKCEDHIFELKRVRNVGTRV